VEKVHLLLLSKKIRHFKRFVKVFLSILVTPNIDYEIKF